MLIGRGCLGVHYNFVNFIVSLTILIIKSWRESPQHLSDISFKMHINETKLHNKRESKI